MLYIKGSIAFSFYLHLATFPDYCFVSFFTAICTNYMKSER